MGCCVAGLFAPPGNTEWVKLQADNFEAIVSTRNNVLSQSRLASLVDESLSSSGGSSLCGSPRDPTVRLDCDADVAREVVAVLRLGRSYVPPSDKRLLKALQHQLDFLQIPAAAAALTDHSEGQAVVLVPSYFHDPSEYPDAFGVGGLLLYSDSAGGWANRKDAWDPRPPCVRRSADSPDAASAGDCWLAAVLPREATGAGEDLVYLVPNCKPSVYEQSAVVLRASTTCHRFSMPPEHYSFVFQHSAMTAARGKLYLLGGEPSSGPAYVPFEVYDAQLDSWFKASSPALRGSSATGSDSDGSAFLRHHALVASPGRGLLLALGGYCGRAQAMSSTTYLYDLASSRWSVNPSACTWPGAPAAGAVAAAAADDNTLVVLSSEPGGSTSRTDLLDVRTWRWRQGAPLQHPASAAGVVVYEGQVLMIGGRRGEDASRAVHAYDPRLDRWSEKPPLPCGVWRCSPVVARVPSTLQHPRCGALPPGSTRSS